MAEKILSIQEVIDDEHEIGWSGYVITTDAQRIEISITNYQDCCEQWGYAMSEDDTDYYIGAQFLDIKVVTKDLAKKSLSEHADYLDEGDAMFVDVETSKGVLQFVLYNSHNGYYSHSARVVSTQLQVEESL